MAAKNTGRYPRHIQEVRAPAKADQDLPQIELKGLDEALATMNEAVERENSSVESILSFAELCRFTTDFRYRRKKKRGGR